MSIDLSSGSVGRLDDNGVSQREGHNRKTDINWIFSLVIWHSKHRSVKVLHQRYKDRGWSGFSKERML